MPGCFSSSRSRLGPDLGIMRLLVSLFSYFAPRDFRTGGTCEGLGLRANSSGASILESIGTAGQAGHQVLGLVRLDAGAKSLIAAGAQVHRGNREFAQWSSRIGRNDPHGLHS